MGQGEIPSPMLEQTEQLALISRSHIIPSICGLVDE